MKITISKSQWERIGKTAGWMGEPFKENMMPGQTPYTKEESKTHRKLIEDATIGDPGEEEEVPSYVRSEINLPTRGKMHRCNACWTDGDKIDNGYVSSDVPYPHADNCKYKGMF